MMHPIDEKRLLAAMLRNTGTPDLQLEEELRQLNVLENAPAAKVEEPRKVEPITDNMVNRVTEAISVKRKSLGMNPIPEKMQDASIEGMRRQLQEVMARIGTMSWGGGGTGIVRLNDADDLVKATLANNVVIKYENGMFVGSREIPTGNLILSNTASSGIKVDINDPVYGWRDIIGNVQPKATGAGSPTRRAYAGGVYADYSFIQNDVCDFVFHIPHDYVPGTDVFFHIHWSHNGTAISGQVVFDFFHTYAKGHNQANFPAEKQVTLTIATPDLATIPQYRHRIDEVVISSDGGSLTLMDRNLLEVDGLLNGTLRVTTLPTITDGYLFIHTCDIHYQSTNMATRGKAPNFYTGV